MKRWIIPDIHGCMKTLQALFDYYIRPSKDDELFFLGDYIDRGPDSKGVLDFIMRLEDEGFKVVALKGNHEESCVQACREEHNVKSFLGLRGRNFAKAAWKQYGGKETMKSFGLTDLRDMPEKYLTWMDGLPSHHMLDNFLLVHAGLNFGENDPLLDEHAMLWVRDFKVDRDKIGGRTLIHGHVSISLETIFMLRDRHRELGYIDLDNGVYMTGREGFGSLVALELNSMELYSQYTLDF